MPFQLPYSFMRVPEKPSHVQSVHGPDVVGYERPIIYVTEDTRKAYQFFLKEKDFYFPYLILCS